MMGSKAVVALKQTRAVACPWWRHLSSSDGVTVAIRPVKNLLWNKNYNEEELESFLLRID